MISSDSAEGVFLGLACGDALGRPLEFKSSDEIARQYGTVTEMLADGTHGKPAGTVSDDTELPLRIARSLVENESLDATKISLIDFWSGSKTTRSISG